MFVDLGTNYTRADIENLKTMYKGQGGEVVSLDGIAEKFNFSSIFLCSFDKPLMSFVIHVKEVKGEYRVVSAKCYDTLPEGTKNIVKGIIEDY